MIGQTLAHYKILEKIGSGLTEGADEDCGPIWSRDGKHIFYVVGARFAEQVAAGNIWSFTLEDGRERPVTRFEAGQVKLREVWPRMVNLAISCADRTDPTSGSWTL